MPTLVTENVVARVTPFEQFQLTGHWPGERRRSRHRRTPPSDYGDY